MAEAVEPLARLMAIEAVRKLRASYFYYLDMKRWDLIAKLFADDAIYDVRLERCMVTGEDPAGLPPLEQSIAEGDMAVAVGGEAIARLIKSACDPWVTVHHGHEPIIEVTGPDTAAAIWPMFDYIDDGKNALKGYGHYHEEYRCSAAGEWRIGKTALTRLRTDGNHPWAEM